MPHSILRFTLYAIIIYLTVGALNPAIAATHPLGRNGTHICGVTDDQWNKRYSDQFPNRRYARRAMVNLNVGEPRTVRLIYFLPNDRTYRADVVQRLKDEILTVQTLYAEWMGTHGYGEVTFRVETDFQDAPMVHDVIGKHPDSYYLNRTFDTVYLEIEEMFNLNANVYLIVIDNSIDAISYRDDRAAAGRGIRLGKSGGLVLLSGGFTRHSIAHELGHAFGLWHDFNDPRYIMSYGGPGRDRLSMCHAEYLSVHPYFNSDTPIAEEQAPTIEPISPRLYPAGSKRVSVQFKVSDPEGLHQVLLFVTTIRPHFAAGFLELKACRRLGGEKDTIVEFDYDGIIPSDGFTSLSDPAGHPITIEVVDTEGNVSGTHFTLAEISPHHITNFDEHTAEVLSVSSSPDEEILASGSPDGTVKLWDVETQTNIATFPHTAEVLSVSFSPDGRILASGLWDGTIELWDIATQRSLTTLDEHTEVVRSVSFSMDGTLASGAWDGTVKLWDVETQTNIATFPHTAEVLSVSFSPDGRILAAGLWSGTIELWDVGTQQHIATLPHGARVISVSFSIDGTLASGAYDGTVKLWDVGTRQPIATFPHTAEVFSVSFSPNGEILASGAYDGTVKLWDVTARINFATLWHTSPVLSVSISSTTLASGTGEGMVELWDTSEWMQLRLEAVAEVHIPDPNLRAAIEKVLNKAPGDTIRALDMENLTRLEASEAGIMDLTGLEAATNLTILDLHRNSITDISVVADLTKLTQLLIWDNNISDMSAVSGLTRLTYLSLGSNPIRDISAVSGLTSLTELYLGGNSITDISAVSGLTRLTVLHLWGNFIRDISVVSGLTNLTKLHLEQNSITDISAVSDLTSLAKLSLWGNSISDLLPLVTNTGLGSGDEILLQRNPLSYLSIHTHIPTLQTRGITVKFDGRAHPALSKVSGDNQEGMPNETLAKLFVVEARDRRGSPLVGVSVTFTIVAGGGTLSVTNTTTDSNGRAQSFLTLGPNLGTNRVEVGVEGIAQTALFRAEAIPPPPIPTTLAYVSGNNQSGLTGETLMQPFVVEIHDQYDNPMEGVTVTFVVSIDGGSLSDTSVDSDVNGLARSTLTLGSDPGANIVEASVEGIAETVTFHATAELLEFDFALPSGISLIHVPLKVRAVNGVAKTIESVGDLYDALGGGGIVNFLITYDSATQEWLSYFGASDTDTPADRMLSDDMGILAGMIHGKEIRLSGEALGSNGSSTITLNSGLNLVGLPLRDSRVTRVSDLFALDEIGGNVPVIILTDGGEFTSVGQAGDPGDIEITGGQAFIMTAQRAATVEIFGDAWTNPPETAATPPVALTGIRVANTTPVLGLRGSIVGEGIGLNNVGFRITVKNLSTRSTVSAATTPDEVGYRSTVVDIEKGRAATVGNVLEISARSPNPFVGVEPLRYTVTAEDVKRNLIQLPALVAYEIPAETELLTNYPNPFNPETWIPYRLAEDAFVTLTIYGLSGQVVRTLDVGHRIAAVYQSRSKAVYWDGRNQVGEQVASGVYFYHLSAGDYSATQKMVILK